MQNFQFVCLKQVMTPIIADTEFEAEQKGKILSYQADVHVSLFAFPQLICSAIENILGNAIHCSNHLIQVTVSVQGNHVVLTIKDDGFGAAQSQLDKIFEAFYRELIVREKNGGVVLALAQHAIKKYRGLIQVNNKV